MSLTDHNQSLTRRVSALSVGVAILLVTTKAVAWFYSGSVALLASLADSGLDLVASLVTFFAVRYAAVPPDAEHRFGHGKAEAFASLIQAALVFASAALILKESVDHVMHPAPVTHGLWAMGAMGVSVVLTLGLLGAQTYVLRQTRSVAISGDRAHYASDLASNLIALTGIGVAALTGFGQFDALAGLAVGALLIWGAIGVLREAADQTLDRELPDSERDQIRALVISVDQIQGVHQLRTRASGPYIHMQMHAELAPDLTLAQAHTIVVEAERRILEAFPTADIIIHPDPKGMSEAHGGAFAESGVGRLH